jgi:hypothetical protein
MKIPEYDQNVSLQNPGPAPTVPADVAAAPWNALAQVGKETFELGKVIQEKQDDILRLKDVAQKTVSAENQLTDLEQKITQERDPETAADRFSEGMTEIKSQALDGVSDLKVMNALTSHLTSKEVEYATKVKHSAFKWTLENNTVDTNNAIDNWTKIAAKDPSKREYADAMIQQLIEGNVRVGAWTPDSGRARYEKSHDDMYAQAAAEIMSTDPMNAPDRVGELLKTYRGDPTRAYQMESRAVVAQNRAERGLHRLDKVDYEREATLLRMGVRNEGFGHEEVDEAYLAGRIGERQHTELGSFVDSFGLKDNAANVQASHAVASDIMTQVYLGQLSAPVAMRRISNSANILPSLKDEYLAKLANVGKQDDKFPHTKDEALQILRNFSYPNGIMKIEGEQQRNMNGLLGEFYDYYRGNKSKIDANPFMLIDWARKRTDVSKKTRVSNSPYKDGAALRAAYDHYRKEGMAGKKADWQAQFDLHGLKLYDWPEGRP